MPKARISVYITNRYIICCIYYVKLFTQMITVIAICSVYVARSLLSFSSLLK